MQDRLLKAACQSVQQSGFACPRRPQKQRDASRSQCAAEVIQDAKLHLAGLREPLSRLYASILVQRLVQFTEQQDLRSPTQAGYRPEHSTIHQAFVLQHAIDKRKRLRSPLYLCFVDLKSAYDRVQWPLLWDLLQRLGVQGKMMGAVQTTACSP